MNYRASLIAAAEAAGLYIAGFIIPVLGQAFALLTPVPLIIAYIRNGRREALTALGLGVIAVSAIGGWQVGAILLFSFGLMAIGTAEGMRRQWKPESAALLGGLLPVAVVGTVAAYYFNISGKDPVLSVENYLRSSVAEAAGLYARIGLKELTATVNSVSDTFIHYLVRLIPGITISTSIVQAACCYGLSRAALTRKPGTPPVTAPAGTTLAAWHAPDVWIWGLIVALLLIMAPQEAARFTGLNLGILYAVVYLLQGLAIVEHYLRKARIRPVVRGLIHALILALPVIVFVIALGLVDIWADVRKVRGTAVKA